MVGAVKKRRSLSRCQSLYSYMACNNHYGYYTEVERRCNLCIIRYNSIRQKKAQSITVGIAAT